MKTPTTLIENRRLPFQFEVRSTAGRQVITGYGAPFNSLSHDLGGFREQYAPTAFNRTLSNGSDVYSFFNHDPNFVLGRTKSGTLRLSTDARGLHFEIDAPETSYGRDLAISMERGDINESSIRMSVKQQDWADTADGTVRTLKEVQLMEIGPVVGAAYPASSSSIEKRSLERLAAEYGVEVTDLEHLELRALLQGENPRAGTTIVTDSATATPLTNDEIRSFMQKRDPYAERIARVLAAR